MKTCDELVIVDHMKVTKVNQSREIMKKQKNITTLKKKRKKKERKEENFAFFFS